MKSIVRNTALLMVMAVMVLGAGNSFAQQRQKSKPAEQTTEQTPDYSKMSKEEVEKDVKSRMEKFDAAYNKLKEKEATATDPQMKADIQKMLTKMDQVRSEMDRMMAQSSTMSEQEQQQAKQKLRTDVEELKAMRDEMMQKYGQGKKGQDGDRQQMKQEKQGQKQQQQPKE